MSDDMLMALVITLVGCASGVVGYCIGRLTRDEIIDRLERAHRVSYGEWMERAKGQQARMVKELEGVPQSGMTPQVRGNPYRPGEGPIPDEGGHRNPTYGP